MRATLGEVLNVHRTMARHPDLFEAWAPLRRHVVADSSLLPRHRELVVLRLAHRAQVAYEWHHHRMRARAAGVGDDEVEAVRSGPDAGWSPDEGALLRATDELFDQLTLSDATWEELSGYFASEQVLDLIVTVGLYTTLAMLINATGVELEGG